MHRDAEQLSPSGKVTKGREGQLEQRGQGRRKRK